ncbi:hypothetical protein [Nostoc sp. 'Peltigera malacea cyanobiont' DB3992]|uniref:hypothetical protein n=1 Tax=Nostoc sp. 'Peltigera malacea cyanobiont' DB3992 TaxID=1206980 RepID=UPI000C050382|nr:hypothetical protein [Nostoc sp. 'Peltigera malacea cyanobiont' DB3992]PHM10543.1 hypothetical protein CK516_07870 [Nostoc sp. 'Peltigera malacea cyanobiont' DB3992]
MSDLSELNNLLGDEALIHYASGREQDRLSKGAGLLELARSQELISRYLPPPPAVIFRCWRWRWRLFFLASSTRL